MFTGIIEEIGTVEYIQKGRYSAVLTVRAEKVLEGIKYGDSIAVNGICLTVISLRPGAFSASVMHETLNRSALKQLKIGSHVNLERAMPVNGRFGGHIVSGHVDGIGKIICIRRDDIAIWYTIQVELSILQYIVEKGSIAIDGISLTVGQIYLNCFAVSVIPHTVEHTILNEWTEGIHVNLETDMIGKYVKKLLRIIPEQQEESKITKKYLSQHGF